MLKLKFARIKSGTIIEVIVAMLIVLTTFLLTMTVFIKLSGNYKSQIKIIALIEANNVINYINYTKNTEFDRYSFDTFYLHKEVATYKDSEQLKEVTLKAFDLNDKLLFSKKIIIIDN